MPRPEQINPRAPQGSPHGATADIQRAVQAGAPPPQEPPGPPTGFPPLPPDPDEDAVAPTLPTPLSLQDDKTGLDDLIFGPTDRPDEPITEGVPFGPGAVGIRGANETDRQFLMRVASTLNTPGAPAAVQRFAGRVARGE